MEKRSIHGIVHVQAWTFTAPGAGGGLVYTQALAVDRMAEGYDVQAVVIGRHPVGPVFHRGCLLSDFTG